MFPFSVYLERFPALWGEISYLEHSFFRAIADVFGLPTQPADATHKEGFKP